VDSRHRRRIERAALLAHKASKHAIPNLECKARHQSFFNAVSGP
jgi:hypothetical protein